MPHATSTPIRYSFNTPAPAGKVYVCGACGNTSPTRSGFNHDNERVANGSWDESCFMHAILCNADGPPWRAVDDSSS